MDCQFAKSFESVPGEGYTFIARDYGGAGVKFELAGPDSEIHAVMLDVDTMTNFCKWLNQVTGQIFLTLPLQSKSAINSALKNKRLAMADRVVLEKIAEVIEVMVEKKTPTGRESSIASRALGRQG
jgi:hypothetical protein